MSALQDIIDKWVRKNHPKTMPGLEVCIYESSLINGLDWAAEEGAEQLATLRADLDEANENLLSMVNQYCCRVVRQDGMPLTYSHDFMSAGEMTFEYLVKHGLAKWCENDVDIYDLQFPLINTDKK